MGSDPSPATPDSAAARSAEEATVHIPQPLAGNDLVVAGKPPELLSNYRLSVSVQDRFARKPVSLDTNTVFLNTKEDRIGDERPVLDHNFS